MNKSVNYISNVEDNEEFSGILEKLFEYFIETENKEKLVKYSRYPSIFSYIGKYSTNNNYKESIKKIFGKISGLKNGELNKLVYEFLKSEIYFNFNYYNGDNDDSIYKNYFIQELSNFILKIRVGFILDIMKSYDKKINVFHSRDFWEYIASYIMQNEVSEIIEILDDLGNILR